MAGIRRSDYDITNTVRVSSPQAVLRAVEQLLISTWPHIVLAPVERAFADFDALFAGRMPGYSGVDTVYHDRQHTLDVTLAMARLLAGYERQVDVARQLTSERAAAGEDISNNRPIACKLGGIADDHHVIASPRHPSQRAFKQRHPAKLQEGLIRTHARTSSSRENEASARL